MPSFQYQARTLRGERIAGRLDAANESALDETLRARGLFVTRVRAEGTPATAAVVRPADGTPLKLNRRDLALFTMHLGTVLKSGLPLSLGLRNSIDEGFNKRVQAVGLSLLERVERGKTLSEAMGELPRAFPEYYVQLIRAGETVGRVDEVLFELLASIEWQDNLRTEIRQASVYPIILMTMLFGVTFGISIFVMPRFVAALSRSGMTLPSSVQYVLGFGQFISTYWLAILLGVASVVMGGMLAADTPAGRYRMDWIKLRLPLIGTLTRQVALSRFAHHLRMMARAGVNFVEALTVVEHVVGNRVLAASVATARERVIDGSSLADALRATGQFTPLVIQMVATGEFTGSLEDTLKKVTEYYDREVPAAVKRITTAIEPIVYVILGVLVLVVALTLYSPLLSMLNQIQTRPRF